VHLAIGGLDDSLETKVDSRVDELPPLHDQTEGRPLSGKQKREQWRARALEEHRVEVQQTAHSPAIAAQRRVSED
jgi:hypothetical protein